MNKTIFVIGVLLVFPALLCNAATVERYDVVWNTPSEDSSGSMPLGNGDIGINVWVEEDGSIYFYISKTDAWSENARLLKLGLVRLRFDPNPFENLKDFKHHLSLQDGSMVIRAGDGSQEITTRLWVDAHTPVIRIETQGEKPYQVYASLQPWRTKKRVMTDEQELHSAYGLVNAPFPVEVSPDTVKAEKKHVLWYHRNRRSIWPLTLRGQGLGSLISELEDPLMKRTFGGLMEGNHFVLEEDEKNTLKTSKSATAHRLMIHVLTAQTESTEAWEDQIKEKARAVRNKDWQAAYRKHQSYWRKFWERSYIHLLSSNDRDREAFIISRGYALQRFISACAGRGDDPIKFNGTIFTVDVKEEGEILYDADYRRWGGPYWFQNTRLCYWPMLKTGDFEMMDPLFQMFLEALPFAKKRTQLYYEHPGAFFPETMYFWGTYAMDNYGWEREGKPISHVDNRYIRYHFNGAIELIAMMIERSIYTLKEEFLHNTLYPFAESVLRFFDEHYPRDKDGELHIEPSQALETWQKATNPLPEVAGLKYVTKRLLDFETIPEELKTLCMRLQKDLPDLPRETEGDQTYLLPAETFDELRNSENPELYAIFPFRLYGLSQPDLEIARETFERRRVKRTGGWTQDPIQAAYLGLVETAQNYTVQNFSTWHEGSRFSAFWGPNFDWIPDQDHGNVSMIALQSMLLQAVGDKILLFPAWPEDWDVEFKLHAPYATTVEGIYKNGKVEKLIVNPEERREDVQIMVGE